MAAAEIPDDFRALPLYNPQSEDAGEPLDLSDIRNSLKSLMWRSAGVRRDGESLSEALTQIEQWCRYVFARQFTDPDGWELQNMLVVARLVIAAAADRQESRGVHYRVDFPQADDPLWNRHQVLRRV